MSLGIKIKQLTPRIYHITADRNTVLAKGVMRFQEYYENPEFIGTSFSIKELKEWYREKFSDVGKFTYSQEWEGFNFPYYVLIPFYANKFSPLSNSEKYILKYFKQKLVMHPYIIATSKEKQHSAFLHEACHALFFTDFSYRKKVLKILKNLTASSIKELHKFLKRNMYSETTWVDEMHAYLSADIDYLKKEMKISPNHILVHNKLKRVFRKHSKDFV